MAWEEIYGGNKVLFCDRDSSRGYHSYPSCYKGRAKYEVTIIYNDYGVKGSQDSLFLCEKCMKGIVSEAEKHNYPTKVRKLRDNERIQLSKGNVFGYTKEQLARYIKEELE